MVASPASSGSGAAVTARQPAIAPYAIGWTVKGTYNRLPVSGSGKVGGVLALQDANRPFPVQADVKAGDLHVALVGTVTDVLHHGQALLAVTPADGTQRRAEVLVPFVAAIAVEVDLAGGRLVGRVDPARSGNALIARKLTMDKPAAAEPMARALVEAASWVGCDNVKLQQVEPPKLEQRLQDALTELGA